MCYHTSWQVADHNLLSLDMFLFMKIVYLAVDEVASGPPVSRHTWNFMTFKIFFFTVESNTTLLLNIQE